MIEFNTIHLKIQSQRDKSLNLIKIYKFSQQKSHLSGCSNQSNVIQQQQAF